MNVIFLDIEFENLPMFPLTNRFEDSPQLLFNLVCTENLSSIFWCPELPLNPIYNRKLGRFASHRPISVFIFYRVSFYILTEQFEYRQKNLQVAARMLELDLGNNN